MLITQSLVSFHHIFDPLTRFILSPPPFLSVNHQSVVCDYEFVIKQKATSEQTKQTHSCFFPLTKSQTLALLGDGLLWVNPSEACERRAGPFLSPQYSGSCSVRPRFSLDEAFLAAFCSAAHMLNPLKRQYRSSFRRRNYFRVAIHVWWFIILKKYFRIDIRILSKYKATRMRHFCIQTLFHLSHCKVSWYS